MEEKFLTTSVPDNLNLISLSSNSIKGSPSIRSPLSRSPPRKSSLQSPKESPLPKSPPSRNTQRKSPISSHQLIRVSQDKVSLNTSAMMSTHIKQDNIESVLDEAVSQLEPQGKKLSAHVDEFTDSVSKLAMSLDNKSPDNCTLEKIVRMSQLLSKEAISLRKSIKCLFDDIASTKQKIGTNITPCEDVSFPYHLFLIELIVNKIHMKCECFEDFNNLAISATFLGKQPIILYNSSYGKADFNKLNVGKSTLFAMTYDKICKIRDFEVALLLTKEPPCSSCVTRIAETKMDYTCDFLKLREELCKKWNEDKPKDEIICTTSTPFAKRMFHLSCIDQCNPESIGVIEVSMRMSFLGKEINTAFISNPKPKGTSIMQRGDNGMSMFSCQKVEMNEQGNVMLDEEVLSNKDTNLQPMLHTRKTQSPMSQISIRGSKRSFDLHQYAAQQGGGMPNYDEIFTQMNNNELKIRVPKSTKVERTGKYGKLQEMCICEDTPYNTGEQIQFEMPRDFHHQTYTHNLKYTHKGCDRSCEQDKDKRKIINVTPTNCPVPSVNMEKKLDPFRDVFILKVGKKLECKDRKTDLEIELCTPKAPNVMKEDAGAQASSTSLKPKLKKDKKKKNGKAGKVAKAKGGKGKKKKNLNIN